MTWRGYKECCYRSALDAEVGFCEECGTPLLRCIAFDVCKGLVGPESPCASCIAPEISLDQGAVTSAGVGHSLALPLILKNTATAPRTLRVDDVRVRRGSGDFVSVPISWQRVEPGEERSFTVETGQLEQGGTANIDVALTLGTSHGGYVESYLFGVSVGIGIAEQQRETTVHQTIDLTGSTGGLVNIKDNSANRTTTQDPGNPDRALLAVTRYERDERLIGLRGYAKTGQHIPRSVEFRFSGFPERHAPTTARIGSRGALVMGRYSRMWHETDNPDPSDVTLRITDSTTGQTDPEASRAVSRRHLDVLVLNERLYIHVRGSNGVAINGEAVGPLSLHFLEDGDTVVPLPKQPDALALTFRFLALPDGTVEAVRIERQPAAA